MPYAILKDKIAEISPQYRGELLAFIDFLLYMNGASHHTASSASRRKTARRPLGGFEDGFYMAPDFDEPLECFKEYM